MNRIVKILVHSHSNSSIYLSVKFLIKGHCYSCSLFLRRNASSYSCSFPAWKHASEIEPAINGLTYERICEIEDDKSDKDHCD